MLCDKLPRAGLAVLPTPLDDAPRLSKALNGPRIWVKRDDRAGLSIGGNKARIFDLSMGEVLAQGYNAVIASAGVQSNKLREMTAAANKLGLKSVIVLTGSKGDEEPVGNVLLFRLLGADIRYFESKDPYAPELMEFLLQIKTELVEQGYRPYVVHRTLKSGTLGSAAYVNAAEELHEQLSKMHRYPDHLYMALGAGITMSGMVLGLKHLKSPMSVTGISIFSSADDVIPEILRYVEETKELLGLETQVTANDFRILDQYRGAAKMDLTPAVCEAINLAAQTEAILFDPVYTGKAMAGLIDQIRKKHLTKENEVVFLHSGGLPALFIYGDKLLS